MTKKRALHIHLLLWIKMETEIVNSNIVWATLHENSEVTTKVKKYQIHTCQSPTCYKYGKIFLKNANMVFLLNYAIKIILMRKTIYINIKESMKSIKKLFRTIQHYFYYGMGM